MPPPQHWKNLVPRNALALLKQSGRSGAPAKAMREVASEKTYSSEYLDIVRAAGGEVTEVLGDGLLALFDGLDFKEDVRAALRAARRIQARTAALNRRRRRHDPITVNIGLNAGPAFTGLTRLRGRSGERWVYSASGPVTNVAARLVALASGRQALTTKATADLLGCGCRPVGPRIVKNVTGPVDVVEILPLEESREPVAKVKTGEPAGDITIERPGAVVNMPLVTSPGGSP